MIRSPIFSTMAFCTHSSFTSLYLVMESVRKVITTLLATISPPYNNNLDTVRSPISSLIRSIGRIVLKMILAPESSALKKIRRMYPGDIFQTCLIKFTIDFIQQHPPDNIFLEPQTYRNKFPSSPSIPHECHTP